MDVETSEAIEQLGQRIDSLEGSLRGEIGSLRGEIGSLRSEVRAGLAENRRHNKVFFESLRDDIRMLAKGFATLTARLDSGRR